MNPKVQPLSQASDRRIDAVARPSSIRGLVLASNEEEEQRHGRRRAVAAAPHVGSGADVAADAESKSGGSSSGDVSEEGLKSPIDRTVRSEHPSRLASSSSTSLHSILRVELGNLNL